jgi:hypothetical protein
MALPIVEYTKFIIVTIFPPMDAQNSTPYIQAFINKIGYFTKKESYFFEI